MSWRVRRALEDIEILLEDGGLTAEVIAQRQHISRRRLDMLLCECIGSTVSAQIMECRLARSASWLCDAERTQMMISEIAYGVGFNDTAHFTRAFRKRFNRTPSQWREEAQR
jgi:AraC-like DNA-binding protein